MPRLPRVSPHTPAWVSKVNAYTKRMSPHSQWATKLDTDLRRTVSESWTKQPSTLKTQRTRQSEPTFMFDCLGLHAHSLLHRELKKLNGSMFVPVAGNPFTRKKREAAKDAAVLARHQEEKSIRSETLHEGYNANQMVEGDFKELTQPRQKLLGTNNATRNRRLEFVDDGEGDDAMEAEENINNDIDELAGLSSQLKGISMAQGRLMDQQNAQLGRITEKVSRLSRLYRYVSSDKFTDNWMQTDAVDDRVSHCLSPGARIPTWSKLPQVAAPRRLFRCRQPSPIT